MGTLTYDGWLIEFEDRLLAHLHVTIVQQLRRGTSFAMSWLDALESGDGRSSIWLHPDGHYYFRFAGSRTPEINRAWISVLAESAESSRGLIVRTEDGKLARSLGTKHLTGRA